MPRPKSAWNQGAKASYGYKSTTDGQNIISISNDRRDWRGGRDWQLDDRRGRSDERDGRKSLPSPASPRLSRLSRRSRKSCLETPRPLAIQIACATPESIACVAAFLCNHLAHGLAAFRTLRRTIGDDLRIALLQPRCGKPFRETARFAKLFADGGYLPREQCARPVDCHQYRICRNIRVFRLKKIAKRYCTKSCRAFSPRSPS